MKSGRKLIMAVVMMILAIAMYGCGNSAAASGGGDASTEELTSLNVGYLPAPGHLLYFIAQEEGYFEEEGLDVTLVQFNENNSELAALESGKIDVGAFGSSELVSFLGDGHDLTIFAGAMKAGHALVVKDSVIEGVSEEDWDLSLLAGKTIGVETVDSATIVYKAKIEEAGLTDEVEYKVFSDGAEVYAALQNDEIDAAVLYAPYRSLAVDSGYTIFSESGEVEGFEDHVCCRQATLTETLEKNPDTYKSFLKALIKAYKFYKENEAESIADISVYVDIDEDLLTADTYDYDNEIANPDPDTEKMTAFYDALVLLDMVDEFDISESLDSELYEEALNEILEEYPDDSIYQGLKEYHEAE